MSSFVQANPNPVGEFQSQFGAPPGTQDPKAECEKWQQLCGRLLADRERLRAELEQARLEKIFGEWDQEPVLSMEQVYAQVERTTTLDQIIADLEREVEAEK